MSIQFECASCSAAVQVPDNAAGKSGKCPKCGARIRVPAASTIAAPQAATAEASPAGRQSSSRANAAAPATPPASPPAGASRPARRDSGPAAASAESGAPESFFAKFGGGGGGAGAADEASGRKRRSESSGAGPSPFSVAEAEPAAAQPVRPIEPIDPFNPPTDGGDADIQFFDDEPDDYQGSPAMAQYRNRQPLPAWVYALPVLAIVIVAAAVAGYMKLNEKHYVGELAGERVEPKKPISVTVSWQEAGATEDQVKLVRQVLDKTPIPLASNLMVVSFLSDVRGIIVEVKDGYDTDIVRIDPHKVPIVSAWLSQNAERLQIARSTTIGRAANDFVSRVSTAVQNQSGIRDMTEFRDRLGVPALNRTLGHWVEAVADGKIFPCIYEDPQGVLYFAVPSNARMFEIQEKSEKTTGRMLPPSFRLTVTVPPRTIIDSPVTEPATTLEGVIPAGQNTPMEPAEPAPPKGAGDL